MASLRERFPDEALESHEADLLEFAHKGPAVLGLGKEALLTRLTTRRTGTHQAVIDHIFREAERRNAYVYTSTHVLAEVIGTIRSGEDRSTVSGFWQNVQDSSVLVLEDGWRWDQEVVSEDGTPVFVQPFEQFETVHSLYDEYPTIDFKFHEAALVLNGVFLEERSDAELTVYLATFDGALAALADELSLDILPYSTDLRNDAAYDR
jgi:hypothetical protein